MQSPVTSGRKRRRRGHVLLLLSLVAAGATLALLLPRVAALFALLVVLILGLERLAMQQAMHALAHRIRSGQLDNKFEVYSGAWGDVCHSVNSLLQQQRRERRLRRLVPPLPLSVAEALSTAGWPVDGTRRSVVVLALGLQSGSQISRPADTEAAVYALRQLAAAAWTCAHTYRALPERYGDIMLLCFGAFDDRNNIAIRDALQSARNIRKQLSTVALASQLRCGLAAGDGHVAAAVELGTSMSGPPRLQALELQALAAASPQDWLFCSEDIYLHLRSEGRNEALAHSRRHALPASAGMSNERRAYALEA